jgi:hypothetical protein
MIRLLKAKVNFSKRLRFIDMLYILSINTFANQYDYRQFTKPNPGCASLAPCEALHSDRHFDTFANLVLL